MNISVKKLVLSLFVVSVFVFYAIYQKQQNSISQPSQPTALTNSEKKTVTKNTKSANFQSTATVPKTQTTSGKYKDGEYIGQSADAYYGNIQVKAVIKNGQISDVVFLDYPQDRNTSIEINSQAMPMLRNEALNAQSAQVDIISGATDSSGAFINSLSSALAQAL